MKLHLLRYFAVLAEELHFGRAAERLAITQPPLSSGIKALEETLGARLFDRSNKHVALTPAGQAYLVEVRAVLERVERAGALARLVASGQQGRLEIGFAGSMVYRDMPAIVRTFAQRAPGIEVQLREMSSSEQLLALAPDPLLCCLPEGHPLAAQPQIALAALAGQRFVMFAREASPPLHDQVLALLREAGMAPRTGHTARQWISVVALVAQHLGVALVPASLQRAGVAGVRFVPLAGALAPITGQLAWHTAHDSPALRTFIACAAEQLAPPFLQSAP